MRTSGRDNEDRLRIPSIDRLLHEPARLIITAHLCVVGRADARFLLRRTGLTWRNLSSHLSKLKTAGYVVVEKELVEDKPRTIVHLTAKGRSALEQYRNNMVHLLGRLTSKQWQSSSGLKAVNETLGTIGHFLEKGESVLPEFSPRDETTEALKKSPTFADLNEQERAELSRLAAERHARSGQFIYFEGDLLEYFYVIVEGRVKICRYSPAGRALILAFRGPGEVLANVAIFSGDRQSCSAQAVVDTRLLAIRGDDFLSFLSNRPEMGLKILRTMLIVSGRRSRSARGQLMELAAERAQHRLAHMLVRLSSEFGTTIPFTREEIAQMAGTSTETAIRFVNDLKKRGIVHPGRRKITILSETELRLLTGNSRQRPSAASPCPKQSSS